MKKTMFALLGGALLLATPACKKGANDPALSLKSRKARLAGEYVISKIDRTTNSSSINAGTTYTSTTTFVYDGGAAATETNIDNSGATTTTTLPISLYEMTINKDGTWEIKKNYQDEYSYTVLTIETTVTTDHITVEKGTWAFLGKTKNSYKNKERVQFASTAYTDTWTQTTVQLNTVTNSSSTSTVNGVNSSTDSELSSPMIYAIDMLKNKEMVFKSEVNYSNNNTNGGTVSSSTYKIDETMTLTQK